MFPLDISGYFYFRRMNATQPPPKILPRRSYIACQLVGYQSAESQRLLLEKIPWLLLV